MMRDSAGSLLRELSVEDEAALKWVLEPVPAQGAEPTCAPPVLGRRTRLLVQLAALLVSDASAESLRWAVELAGVSGADDEAIAAVLVATGPAAGSAQLVACAPRLALALGLEPDDVNGDY